MHGEAFAPYAPLNAPKPFGDEIWVVDGPEIHLHAFGLKLPCPTRMTLVRLSGGGLFVHSPVELDAELAGRVEALGKVRWLIAPNTMHYWWIPEWSERFGEAEVHAAPGLRRWARRSLPITANLGPGPAPGWGGEIDQVIVRGDRLTEATFFHRRSQTLILTDLIENFEPGRVRSRLLRRLIQLSGRSRGGPPNELRLAFLRHRPALRAALRKMIAWEPQRIVVAHGLCFEADAVEVLKRAFAWVL